MYRDNVQRILEDLQMKLYLTLWICGAILFLVWMPIFTKSIENSTQKINQRHAAICQQYPEYCDQ